MKESMMMSLVSACIQMNEINYVHFANQKLLSPFAPTWDYFIAEKLISNIQYTRLKNYLLSKQQEIFSIKDNLEQLNILNYFFKDDESDLLVKDIIVGETINTKENGLTKDNSSKSNTKIDELNEKIDSESQVIELLE